MENKTQIFASFFTIDKSDHIPTPTEIRGDNENFQHIYII